MGILWVLTEKFGAAFLSVAVFFVYAKFLGTDDMGVAIVILSVTQFLALLLNTFFEDALVQKHSITDADIDTTFWVSNALSVTLTILTSFGFWFWGRHMTDYPVFAMASFAALEILFTNLGTTYVARLRREGRFKALAFRVILGRIGGAVVGLACILSHLGAWSILAQSVVGAALQLAILFYSVRKMPTFDIRLHLLKDNLHFGLMLALRRLSWDALVRMTPIAAGLVGGTSAAGLIGFAWRIVELPRSAISSGLSSYLLPLLSRERGDKEKMSESFTTITGINAFFMAPLFLGLYIAAPALITGIFDEKWHDTADLIQILSIAALIGSYRIPATVTMSAAGHPGKMLAADTIGSLLAVGFMFAFGSAGVWTIAVAHLLFNIIVLPKSFSILKEILGLPAMTQLAPVLRYAFPGNIMFIALYAMQPLYAQIPPLATLAAQIGTGILFFSVTAFLFHRDELRDRFKKFNR